MWSQFGGSVEVGSQARDGLTDWASNVGHLKMVLTVSPSPSWVRVRQPKPTAYKHTSLPPQIKPPPPPLPVKTNNHWKNIYISSKINASQKIKKIYKKKGVFFSRWEKGVSNIFTVNYQSSKFQKNLLFYNKFINLISCRFTM